MSTTSCFKQQVLKIPRKTLLNPVTNHLRQLKMSFLFSSRLMLPLPHPVDHSNGNAKWNGETETLEVTLTLRREYDFINFQ